MKSKRALEGIKAVDFGWIVVMPLTMKYLADNGATVVRIETHARPDMPRTVGPFGGGQVGINRSGYYARFNSSKYGVTLDLNKPKGREVALRFIKWADIVGEGHAPGAMERWGLDYETVRKIKPDIIYLSTSIQGQTGPRAAYRGYGYQASALAGAFNISGWPDTEPASPYGPYTDYFSPRFGSSCILAALDYRRRTGKGQYLDQSQMEGGIQFLGPALMDCSVNGRVMGRYGNRLPYAAPHGAFRCQGEDRWCTIAVFTDEEWDGLCEVIGQPEWTRDAKFATMRGRKGNEEELERLVEEWTSQHTAEEVMTLLQAAGVPSGVVKNAQDVFEDPQLKKRRHFQHLEHPEIGLHSYETQGFVFSKTPTEITRPAPCLGEHNEQVYKEFLGMSDDEIAELLIEGVITTEADLPDFKAFV